MVIHHKNDYILMKSNNYDVKITLFLQIIIYFMIYYHLDFVITRFLLYFSHHNLYFTI